MRYSLYIQNNKTLQIRNINIALFFVLISILSLGCSFGYVMGSISNHPNMVERILYEDKIIVQKYNEEFTIERLNKLLKQLKVKHTDLVIAQCKLETGNFNSKVFHENNNLFGMKLPSSRITTAIGDNLNHAKYSTWQESVIDYAIYQSTYLRNTTREQYIEYLRLNYAQDENYIQKLISISKLIKNGK